MNTKIIGDKKKRRYNEGLFDIVNKKYEKEIIIPEPDDVIGISGNVIIDKNPLGYALGGAVSTSRESFHERFNDAGRIMISLPDLYQASKTCDEDLLRSLRKDCEESAIITNTEIVPSIEPVNKIIHHWHQDKIIRRVVREVYVPYMNQWSLDTVLNLKIGLDFIRALFNTEDSAEDIEKTLERLSDRDSEKIFVETVDKKIVNASSAFVLFYQNKINFKHFHICEKNFHERFSGRSRGVNYVN